MGKQIRIYLADGTSTGIRHAEITNWSGQALACPRSRFSELKGWNEIKRPGVYFLVGLDEETGEDAVYIGESEVVIDRLSSHLTGKDFWSEFIVFTSKDDNLTKGHVKYLESRLIELAQSAKRYKVINTTCPQLSALPRGDVDAMEEYLTSVRALIGVLGHRVLDPYSQPVRTLSPAENFGAVTVQAVQQATSESVSELQKNASFSINVGGIKATAERTDEGFVVISGSEAAFNTQASLSSGYQALREKLLTSGTLIRANGKLQFTKDHLFNSPSQAAAIVVGYSINGRESWRLPNGTTYGDYEQKQSAELLRQIEHE